MKFYEFNTSDFSYYALINVSEGKGVTDTIEKAKEIYKDVVCDLEAEEKEKNPIELSKDEAFKKCAIAYRKEKKFENAADEELMNEFNKEVVIYHNYGNVLLIDGSLI